MNKCHSHAILITSAPFTQSGGQDALELALTLATFEQPVALFFSGQGIYQLLPKIDGEQLSEKNYPQGFKALNIYDIEQVYVLAEDLFAANLQPDNLSIPVDVIAAPQWFKTLKRYDVQLRF